MRFEAPRRLFFQKRSDAIRRFGIVEVDMSGTQKKFYVDVCPACCSTTFLPTAYLCACGNRFDRKGAVVTVV